MLCTKIDNELYVIGDDFDDVYFGSWENDPRRKCKVIYNEHLELIRVHPITLEQEEYIDDGDSWYHPTTSRKLAYWNYNGMCDGYASTPHYVALYPIKEYFQDIIKEQKQEIELSQKAIARAQKALELLNK